jgi:uncharacterized protein YdeI (YjbR/CyaY-like superfamily)
MLKTENFDKVEVKSTDELRQWLINNHKQLQSVWLVTYKSIVPEKYLPTAEVLDELLCFGWIDGIRRKLDETKTMQLISPRRVEHWSRTYKERANKLIELGKMEEAGFVSIESSKQNGLWDFLNDVDNLIIPSDLSSALKGTDGAFEFFNAINPSSKRFVLRWLKLAKTNRTRTSRIEQLVALSAKGEKLKGS